MPLGRYRTSDFPDSGKKYDAQFRVVFTAIKKLMDLEVVPPKPPHWICRRQRRLTHPKSRARSFARLSGGRAYFPRFEGQFPEIYGDISAAPRARWSRSPSLRIRCNRGCLSDENGDGIGIPSAGAEQQGYFSGACAGGNPHVDLPESYESG